MTKTPAATAPFELVSAGRVVFGAGTFLGTAEMCRPFGRRALVVTGRSAMGSHEAPSPYERLTRALAETGIHAVHLLVRGEPSTQTADDGARTALASGCEMVIGLGGGAVLDAAKAIAGLVTNGGEALDYLEVVGRGRAIEVRAAPLIAVPTTAGTGSEVTKNAVLTEPRARIKASIRSPLLLPSLAIVDPLLTLDLPPALTASTGLDALTQLIESYITPRANALTDLLAREGIRRSARSLLRARGEPHDIGVREDLALASLFGGHTLANAGLGAVHGIAAPLGGRFGVPHGVACAVLLPHVLAANLAALRREDPAGIALGRIAEIGELLAENIQSSAGASVFSIQGIEDSGSDYDRADLAVLILRGVVKQCHLPGLASFGLSPADLPELAEASLRSSSMKGNPVALSPDEIAKAIVAAL